LEAEKQREEEALANGTTSYEVIGDLLDIVKRSIRDLCAKHLTSINHYISNRSTIYSVIPFQAQGEGKINFVSSGDKVYLTFTLRLEWYSISKTI
jgi:hypothetical protein